MYTVCGGIETNGIEHTENERKTEYIVSHRGETGPTTHTLIHTDKIQSIESLSVFLHHFPAKSSSFVTISSDGAV